MQTHIMSTFVLPSSFALKFKNHWMNFLLLNWG